MFRVCSCLASITLCVVVDVYLIYIGRHNCSLSVAALGSVTCSMWLATVPNVLHVDVLCLPFYPTDHPRPRCARHTFRHTSRSKACSRLSPQIEFTLSRTQYTIFLPKALETYIVHRIGHVNDMNGLRVVQRMPVRQAGVASKAQSIASCVDAKSRGSCLYIPRACMRRAFCAVHAP